MTANDTYAIKVDGLDDLRKRLNKLSPDLAKELKQTNRKMADRVAPVAAGFAPVRSGRLRDSIRSGATVRSGVVRAGKKSVPYAGPIHFGWPSKRIKPNPFMWEALDKRRDEIINEYQTRLAELAKEV